MVWFTKLSKNLSIKRQCHSNGENQASNGIIHCALCIKSMQKLAQVSNKCSLLMKHSIAAHFGVLSHLIQIDVCVSVYEMKKKEKECELCYCFIVILFKSTKLYFCLCINFTSFFSTKIHKNRNELFLSFPEVIQIHTI